MKTGRTAIIDLGTNTCHLLIADSGKRIIHEEKMPVKMGVGGINQGIITEGGIERTMQCLKIFSETCQQFGVGNIQAIGTSALRNAKNVEAIVEQAKRETDIDIKIISGDEEAKLIYLGVRQAVPLGIDKSLIVDIGGGSVEFLIANEAEIYWKKSIEIGGQRLFERFHKHDPIFDTELLSLRQYLSIELQPVAEALEKFSPLMLVGSSGSFETLSDIFCVRMNLPNPQKPCSPLSREVFEAVYSDLIKLNEAGRIAMPGMMAWRAEMIVVTCTLIKVLLSLHEFSAIKVSRYSLKEGVLFG
jgi:exopolyphosphatase / guanosine-5'-triphosphate,3'-diphosphate pyrophosphatase